MELPPRARRIHYSAGVPNATDGTTSACAENTGERSITLSAGRNYLRVRGEYRWCYPNHGLPMELPPRARRIPAQLLHQYRIRGTTSACAENTQKCLVPPPFHRNYLRVRGEYDTSDLGAPLAWELPPRARRIPLSIRRHRQPIGTTSACAENTTPPTMPPSPRWNYLRVRGEYDPLSTTEDLTKELPPRARRIQGHSRAARAARGTTSACAENTVCSVMISP